MFKQFLDQNYECKHHWFGFDNGWENQIRVQNRVVSWNEEGTIDEADQRHVEVVVSQIQIAEGKSAFILSIREEQTQCSEVESDEFSSSEASKCRMIAARLIGLTMDRVDTQHASKEASKYMAKPHSHHWSLLKRIARYCREVPRGVQVFSWQTSISIVVGHSGSDWVGDRKARETTSGGVCRVGPHVVKTWWSTQHIIVLSSAEVEFHAFFQCACQTLGVLNLALHVGIKWKAIAHTDASAAFAIAQRQGLAKLRHIDLH